MWLVAAAGLVLAGPAGTPATAADAGKLLIWIDGNKGYRGLQKVGDEFKKKAGVAVTVEHPDDLPAKFKQAAAAGKGPDIVISLHDRLGEWTAGRLLVNVTPGRKTLADLDPMAVKAFTSGGKQWGYPMAIEAAMLIYNKSLVAMPPQKFEDVRALDASLAKQGKKAILWDYTNPHFTWPLMAAGGAYAFKQNADGTYNPADTGVNNAGAVKGVEMLAGLVKDGVMPKGAGYADMETGMAQGKVAMMIAGPGSLDNLRRARIDVGVARIPSVGGKKAVPFVTVLGAMISTASPNRQVAQQFIEDEMLALAGLKIINTDVPLGTPASKAFFAELKSIPVVQATMASAQDGVLGSGLN